jgi:hypothetical protein
VGLSIGTAVHERSTAEKGYECANARLVKTPNGYHLPRSIIVDLGILRDA